MTQDPAATDPLRGLAVLWRTHERASRPGRPELSVDRIAAAGIELADESGLGALSMRRVAERLGVGAMSLYTYVPGKAELVDVMADTVLVEVLGPPWPAAGEDEADAWRDRLSTVARANWDLFRRHAWLLHIATSRPAPGPNLLAKYEHELRAIDGIGLTDLEMDSVLSLVLGHAEIAARRSVDATQTTQRSGLTDAQWWAVTGPFLERVVDGSRYPLAGRVGTTAGETYNAPSDPAHDFAFGLERILDGVAALLDARVS